MNLGLELSIDAYEAYILEAARSSGFPLLALDGPIRRNAKKLGLSLVELTLLQAEMQLLRRETIRSPRKAIFEKKTRTHRQSARSIGPQRNTANRSVPA